VKAGGYEADTRGTLGGVLNVVTYSGTNELHGSVFDSTRATGSRPTRNWGFPIHARGVLKLRCRVQPGRSNRPRPPLVLRRV